MIPKIFDIDVARISAELSPGYFDLDIDTNEVTVYSWEKNRSSPKLQHIPKVVEFLGYVPFGKRTGDPW